MQEMAWMSVNGWARPGRRPNSAPTASSRTARDFYAIAKTIEQQRIDGLLVIGGWEAYQGAYRLFEERSNFPAFEIPMVCLPATIDNNLPGTELSIGADTALNNIVSVVDKIKQSAVAERRCYIVEVMGRRCGYLALMSGLATGAERVYLHEEGVTLKSMKEDLDRLIEGFREGKRLGLVIRNEEANPTYDTPFMCGAVRGGERRRVRRAREHPRAPAAGRRPVAVRPDPGDQARPPVDQPSRRAGGGSAAVGVVHRHGGGPGHVPPARGPAPDDRRAEPTAEDSSGGSACGRSTTRWRARDRTRRRRRRAARSDEEREEE